MVSVVRVAVVAVVHDVNTVRQPTHGESRCNAPEKTTVEGVRVRIRIVINRICLRVVIINRARLIDDDVFGLVIGYVYYVFLDRRNFDRAFIVSDRLV